MLVFGGNKSRHFFMLAVNWVKSFWVTVQMLPQYLINLLLDKSKFIRINIYISINHPLYCITYKRFKAGEFNVDFELFHMYVFKGGGKNLLQYLVCRLKRAGGGSYKIRNMEKTTEFNHTLLTGCFPTCFNARFLMCCILCFISFGYGVGCLSSLPCKPQPYTKCIQHGATCNIKRPLSFNIIRSLEDQQAIKLTGQF